MHSKKYLHETPTKRYPNITDAYYMGLECETGNVDDCDDLPDESAPTECSGVLFLSEKESQCGSNCHFKPRSAVIKKRWWTLWTSQA